MREIFSLRATICVWISEHAACRKPIKSGERLRGMETDVVTENPWATSHEKDYRPKRALLGIVVLLGTIVLLVVAIGFIGTASASGGCGGG